MSRLICTNNDRIILQEHQISNQTGPATFEPFDKIELTSRAPTEETYTKRKTGSCSELLVPAMVTHEVYLSGISHCQR